MRALIAISFTVTFGLALWHGEQFLAGLTLGLAVIEWLRFFETRGPGRRDGGRRDGGRRDGELDWTRKSRSL